MLFKGENVVSPCTPFRVFVFICIYNYIYFYIYIGFFRFLLVFLKPNIT